MYFRMFSDVGTLYSRIKKRYRVSTDAYLFALNSGKLASI